MSFVGSAGFQFRYEVIGYARKVPRSFLRKYIGINLDQDSTYGFAQTEVHVVAHSAAARVAFGYGSRRSLKSLLASDTKRQARTDPQLVRAFTADVRSNVVSGHPQGYVVREVEIYPASASHGESRLTAR